MTSNSFQTYGRALLGNGYLIIPIKPGHKRPALDNWQTARLGAADLTRYPGHGVGVLCGQGAQPVAAIDATQPTVSRILSGRHKDPRYSVVEKLRQLVLKLDELTVAA